MDKLREARAQAEEAVSCHVTQFKIKVWFFICSYRQSSQQFNGKKAVEGVMNFFFFYFSECEARSTKANVGE